MLMTFSWRLRKNYRKISLERDKRESDQITSLRQTAVLVAVNPKSCSIPHTDYFSFELLEDRFLENITTNHNNTTNRNGRSSTLVSYVVLSLPVLPMSSFLFHSLYLTLSTLDTTLLSPKQINSSVSTVSATPNVTPDKQINIHTIMSTEKDKKDPSSKTMRSSHWVNRKRSSV